MPRRSRLREWFRLWKPPVRDQYGLWAGVGATLVAVGTGLLFTIAFAVGVLCIGAAVYTFLGIFLGLPLPPTHADWEAYKQERFIAFLSLRDVIREVHTELEAALGQLERDLGNGTYSGVILRQDAWAKNGTTIRNDPVFTDVSGVIERAYEAMGVHSERSYDAASRRAEPEIPSREIEELRQTIAVVDEAQKAAAMKVDELGVDQP